MSGSINKVMLVGNLGADPEVRVLQSGMRICNLRVATSESWKDKTTGDRKEKTDWHRVTIYNDAVAKFAEQYCHKGSTVGIEGKLENRKWKDQSGQERWTTEIVIKQFEGDLTLIAQPQPKGSNGPTVTEEQGEAAAPITNDQYDNNHQY